MSVMISAIGVSYLLQNLATYLFTALPKGYPNIPVLKRVIVSIIRNFSTNPWKEDYTPISRQNFI